MSLAEMYEREEQSIIDDESLSPEEKRRALRDLYREGRECMGEGYE